MTGDGTTALPNLDPGDVYLYAHANGGIVAIHGDGRSMDLTIHDALAIARRVVDDGARVVVAGDDAPLAVDVLARLGRTAGVPLEPFAAPRAPQSWPDGADALIAAAAHGADRILDDLVARGADLHHRAADGSTALHHAAAVGNLHAIEALIAAGSRLDVANGRGATPLRLAEGRGHTEAAALLRSYGEHGSPDPSVPGTAVTFRRAHLLVAMVWLYPPVLLVLVLAFTWPDPVALVVVGGLGALCAALIPPLAAWVGGAPRRLEGSNLVLRRAWGATVTIDLRRVTLAGAGGSTNTGGWGAGRWVLLAHPDGARVRRGTLRRLLVPAADRPLLRERADRLVAVAVEGSARAEVYVALAGVLVARGVPTTATLAAQVSEARAGGGRGPAGSRRRRSG